MNDPQVYGTATDSVEVPEEHPIVLVVCETEEGLDLMLAQDKARIRLPLRLLADVYVTGTTLGAHLGWKPDA